jgi:predicted amidohydrolase
VLFPENRDHLREVAAPFENHPQLRRIGELARQHGMHVHVGSLAVPLADGRFANRSVLFGPDGEMVATYDKIHLFDADIAGLNAYRESATYAGGEQAVTASLGEFTLGMSICYDMRFPKLYNSLANAGATLIAVPAAFTVPTGQAHWHVLLRARAIETGSYVIAAAQGGQHPNGRATYGHSLVVDPWGRIVAELDHDEPGVLLAEISPDRVVDARQRIPALANARNFAPPATLQA